MGLQLGEYLRWLMNGEIHGRSLADADFIDRVTLVSALAAKVYRIDLVLRTGRCRHQDRAALALLPPLVLRLRVTGRSGHAREYHPRSLNGHRRVRGDPGRARLVPHSNGHAGERRVISAFSTGRMDRVHRATRVIAGVIRRDPGQAQNRTGLPELWPTLSQPFDHRWHRIGGHIAVNGHAVLHVGQPDDIALDRHRGRIEYVQVKGSLAPFAESVVRLTGVLAGILQRDLWYHVLEAGGDEAAVPPPANHTDRWLRVHVTFETGGAVHFDLQRVLRTDGDAREVVDVQGHRSVQSLALAHRPISHDASEDGPVVLPGRLHQQRPASVQWRGTVTPVPPDFRLRAAAIRVALQLQLLTLRGRRGGRRYRRWSRRPQHRQGDVLPVEVNAGTTGLHPALVLAVVALVRHVPDLQVVSALLQVHEHLVVRREGAVLDRRVVEVVVRMSEPEARGVLARWREPTLQLHGRTFVRVHLRLLDACSDGR